MLIDLTNVGTAPLAIAGVWTTSRWSATLLGPTIVPAGGKVQLRVRLNSLGMSGELLGHVTVATNERLPRPTAIALKAFIT
jgi:hypothetical protein